MDGQNKTFALDSGVQRQLGKCGVMVTAARELNDFHSRIVYRKERGLRP